MWCGVLWLTVCLMITIHSHSLTVRHIVNKTETPEETTINKTRSRATDSHEPGYEDYTTQNETTELPIETSSKNTSEIKLSDEVLLPQSSELYGADNDRIEQTTHGPVKGYKWKDTNINAFYDIPYGKINSPFEAPHTAQTWTEVHEDKKHSTHCPQFNNDYIGDINCLTLSIFAPDDAVNAGVFFYIHDSSFRSGDPMIYGPEHLVSKGVILILPNYRIGAPGFLCLQNETAPGNAGLKDLTEALKWTKNNIVRFGGNPLNIVVGGDGDAGALAGYLALCSPSKHYIKNVITESGSMLSHLALDRNPLSTATKLAENIRNNYEVIYNNTFAEASAQTIVEAAKGIRFNPCIEHNKEPFIDVSPWTLLQNTEINTTFMIGSASHAGTHEAVATTESFIEQLNADYRLIFPKDLLFNSRETRDEYALKVKTQYFGDGNITRSQMTQLSLLSTDTSYLGPLIRSARTLVDTGATVYLYEFDFVGSLNRELISLNTSVEGAVRSDIIGYLFTQSGHDLPDEETPEKRMVSLLVDLWVSFIKTGTPTAENIKWKKMKVGDDSDEEFLQITSNPGLVRGVHVDRLRLWTELYDQFFIERNSAPSLIPDFSIFITITLWITNTKLD